MGSLAKYGALAGLGQGLKDVAANKREERIATEAGNAAEKRAMRVAKWQSDQADRRAGDQRGHDIEVRTLDNTARAERESDQRQFEGTQNTKDRQNRLDVAQIQALGGSGGRDPLQTYLAKGDDVKTSTQQSVDGKTTYTITKHQASGTSWRRWNTPRGGVNFPEGRDPVELAPQFAKTQKLPTNTSSEQKAARAAVVRQVIQAEDRLIQAIGTDVEAQMVQRFESLAGYIPLTYLRIRHAQSILGP